MDITGKPIDAQILLGELKALNMGVSSLGTRGNELVLLGTSGEEILPPFPAEFFTVVNAHIPPPPPPKMDLGGDIPVDQESKLATGVDTLRQYINLSAPTAAQSASALKLLIRIVLWYLKKQGL